ncbi:hypothetical protein E2C01_035472 [Portunus trituberculatus]|uniref:Uncharacterized protein n=1 Tax=Portunus trituberculatus TaxID=210409 RepID=A0A5B7F8F4_PORTR|nr:hypothetical protein [Portunus trituberculatus]
MQRLYFCITVQSGTRWCGRRTLAVAGQAPPVRCPGLCLRHKAEFSLSLELTDGQEKETCGALTG